MSIIKPKEPITELESTYQKFWQGFNKLTQQKDIFCCEFKPHPYASTRCYQDYSVGKPYHIVAKVSFAKKEIQVGAYFNDLDAYQLYSDKIKNRIEVVVGKKLMWRKHNIKASAYLYDSADFDDSHGWEQAYKIIIVNMLLLKKAFEIELSK